MSNENQPPVEGTSPQFAPPVVEATGVQAGGPHPSTQTRIRKDQPEIPGYEFLKRLGKGGMGVVWLCKDVRAGRLVALKQTISDELSESDRQRFRTEAQAMAKLQHPNIVHVYEVNEHEGRPYFTMDYCPGGSLHEYLDRKPQPAKICAEIVEKLALGVEHAHENGIIHRDLKPANVLISSEFGVRNSELKSDSADSTNAEERQRLFNSALRIPNSALLKLTDFGLAKNIEASQQFTRTESVMGTPSYMSPEQGKETKSAGPAADVWSLGVILYECITGSLPFVGADLIEVLDNIRHKDPVPPSEKVKCPRDLETICLKCLRKDPRDRYASAQALADDLRAFQEERSISARPMGKLEKSAKWVRRNPRWAAMVTLLVLTLITGTAVSLFYAGIAEYRTRKLKTTLKEVEMEQEKTQEALAHNRILLAEATFNGTGTVEQANELIDAIPEKLRNWEHGFLKRKYVGSFAAYQGHLDVVSSASFSPDGSRIASGSKDRKIRVWASKTGRSLLELTGHIGPVTSVRFSPDGCRIVSGAEDGTVRIWDAKTGASLLELTGHTGIVGSVSFSPDGSRIASGSWDKTVRIWDAKSGHSLLELRGHIGSVRSICFAPDGSRIVSGGDDTTVRVWNAKSGRSLLELKGPTRGVFSVSYSPDGSRIAAGCGDDNKLGEIWVWNARSGLPVFDKRANIQAVVSLSFSPDGTRIVSGSLDRTIRIFDARSGDPVLELKGHFQEPREVSFSPDGTRIASAGEKTVRVWDARRGQSVLELRGHPQGVFSVSFSPDGSRIAAGCWDHEQSGEIRVWDLTRSLSALKLNGLTKGVPCVSFSPDGNRIASGSSDGILRVWDSTSGQSLLEMKRDTETVRCLCFSPDGTRIASSGQNHSIRLWDSKSGHSLLELKGHTDQVESVGFSSIGDRIASGSFDNTIRVWDAGTGQSLLELKGHTDRVSSVSFSSEGSRIASGSWDRTIRIWDAGTGQSLLELKGHNGFVTSVNFSPDGSRIASGSEDNTIRIWDAKSGQSLLELKGHTSPVLCVSFSPDGSRIASGTWDGTIRIWDSWREKQFLTNTEFNFRLAMWQPDPIWHREWLEEFTNSKSIFAASMQNYLLHKAIAEEHFDYNRFDQAFYWSVAAQMLKPKPPVIDWPELLAKPKEIQP